MKVYVVYGIDQYQGNNLDQDSVVVSTLAVFSKKKYAQKFADTKRRFSRMRIQILTLDKKRGTK